MRSLAIILSVLVLVVVIQDAYGGPHHGGHTGNRQKNPCQGKGMPPCRLLNLTAGDTNIMCTVSCPTDAQCIASSPKTLCMNDSVELYFCSPNISCDPDSENTCGEGLSCCKKSKICVPENTCKKKLCTIQHGTDECPERKGTCKGGPKCRPKRRPKGRSKGRPKVRRPRGH